jgi:hypothetical protein
MEQQTDLPAGPGYYVLRTEAHDAWPYIGVRVVDGPFNLPCERVGEEEKCRYWDGHVWRLHL